MIPTIRVRIRSIDWHQPAAPRFLGLTLALFLWFPVSAFSQADQGYVRVPERQTHTDVKAGSSSGSEVLVLVPKGTVLPVIGRRGEWIQVRLSPELRKVGILMRWYKNEDSGFVHESTVEVIKGKPPSSQAQEQVRVRDRQTHTDVKAGPSSGSEVLVLVPKGAVLPAIGRRGEWIQVRLSPELRKVGILMRWYKNEDSGFVHESTVEVIRP